MSDWCILRTAGRSTLGLAESLAKDGFEVWTPVETRRIKGRDFRRPIMPGYVFADLDHVIDLLELARMPVKPRRGPGLREPAHADFSLFRSETGRVHMARDKDLDGLRDVEIKHTPRRLRPQLIPAGSRVRVSPTHGSFGGMVGHVDEVKREQALVCFNGRFVVKIPTFLLNLDELYVPPQVARAA